MHLIFFSLSIIFSSLLFSQQSFEDFKRQQEQAFNQYKESITKEYDAYEAAEKAAFEKFKEDVERQWEEFKGSTAKTYVSYDEDLQSRASIDYENGHLSIEVIIDEETVDIEGKDIVLSMVQSISMKEYPKEVFDQFGLAVFDECHHLGAEVFFKSMQKNFFVDRFSKIRPF